MIKSTDNLRNDPASLAAIFDGWEGYHVSIVHAIQPLTLEQLAWRPAPDLRSTGELASHIALGRVEWFARMSAPGSLELVEKWTAKGQQATIAENHDEIIGWLELSWNMVANTLDQWTVEDLSRTYRQEYQGHTFAISYQWTIWRIMTHDIHHGGELALMLGLQGIKIPELGDLFGHLVMPPLAK